MKIEQKLAYSPATAANKAGVGRTKIFEAIKTGDLQARKMGRRTLIMHGDLIAWLLSLPKREPSNEAA